MKCLLCYKPLTDNSSNYHSKCVANVFGLKEMPIINIDEQKLASYAKETVGAKSTITGVQPKLSLWLEKSKTSVRFTLIDNKSNYIIKPQSETFSFLPENEDLCMCLANEFGIETAQHSLVKLQSGALAYITKRFERDGENKLACEDLCQLSEKLTEHKYRGSYEQTGKIIQQYSTQAGLDALHFFELVLFSFITGNADMHLKNFSMLEKKGNDFTLSPAYDLVSTALIMNDPEQMSLTLNGKKNKITKRDFDSLATSLLLNKKQVQNIYEKFQNKLDAAIWWIENSFLPNEQKEVLKQLVKNRIEMFG